MVNSNQQPVDDPDVTVFSRGTSKAQSNVLPHRNVAMNDGTHRVTVRWSLSENPHTCESNKKKLNDSIHELLICTIFPPEIGILYRWESEDLLMSNSAQN